MNHPSVAVFALIFSSCLWGLSWLPLKALNEMGFDGLILILSGQFILSFVFLTSGFKKQWLVSHRKSLMGIFWMGGGAILCFTYALIYGDVIRVMVLFYLLPVWGVIGGRLFLKERIDRLRWFGMFLAILGAFFILGGVRIFDAPPTWIDLIALVSGIFFAINNILFRAAEIVPLSCKLLAMFVGCTCLSFVSWIFAGAKLPLNLPMINYAWPVVYALTWLLLANVLTQWAVTRMDAGRSSIIIIVELIAAVISAMIIGEESMTSLEVLGCAMVVIAALQEAFRFSASEPLTVNNLS